MKKILVLLGPTATGKTDLALQLASKFGGELISADSRQVYRNLDIGTGKEPGKRFKNKDLRIKKYLRYWEINGIKIWMYDVVSPEIRYTVADYVKQAGKIIEDILKRKKLPIIVGGTGFYIKALLEGIPNLDIPVDFKSRGEVEQLSLDELKQKLQVLDPRKWELMNNSDRNNKRRLLRSIELISMYPYKRDSDKGKVMSDKYQILKIGLTASRQILYQRIDQRLKSRIDQGLIEEGQRLRQNGLRLERMKELGLEYGSLADLLVGKISQDQFFERLKNEIHHFAKRQMTWFKQEKNIKWFDITDNNFPTRVENEVILWYDLAND